MTDRGPLFEQDEPPEDVATLYSWANLHGAKYRDFSASRAQTREKARLRVQQAMEEEKAHALDQGEPQHGALEPPREIQGVADQQDADRTRRATEMARAQEEALLADLAAQKATMAAVQRAAEEAAQKAARDAAERAAQQAAEHAALQAEALAARQAADQAARFVAEQTARQAAEQAARNSAEQTAEKLAAQRAVQEAELRATRQAAEQAAQQLAAQRAAQQPHPIQDAAQRATDLAAARQAAEQAAQQLAAHRAAQDAAQRAWRQPFADRFPAAPTAEPAPPSSHTTAPAYPASPHLPPVAPHFPSADTHFPSAAPHLPPVDTHFPPAEPRFPLRPDYPAYTQPQAHAPAQSQPKPAAMREESHAKPRNPWSPVDPGEVTGRPAWLNPERPEVATPQAVPQAPEDTLQGSRDRLTSRWYALRGVFEGVGTPADAAPAPAPARAPVVAIFSLAGGVGKTSIVATLGRALSARGERVLLVDTAPYGLLPFFFGARDQRPGLLRTFSPPGTSGDAPIQMVTIDPEGLGPETPAQDPLTSEVSTYSRGVSRVIVDLATASGATTRRILRLAPLVVVPLIPDMNSVVSFSSIDSFFQHNGNPAMKPSLPYYVLNQFDPSLPLHLDIREVLREQLGDRLLPFVLRRAPVVSEALAEGMTVMDYAPNSTVAEDFGGLAAWVKSQSAPASSTYRGVRWSER